MTRKRRREIRQNKAVVELYWPGLICKVRSSLKADHCIAVLISHLTWFVGHICLMI